MQNKSTKFPRYFKFRSDDRVSMHALLSSNRIVSAIHYTYMRSYVLETIVSSYDVNKVLRTRNLKEIKGEEFYKHYLVVRRSLNKQCISLIKSLNKVPL